MKHIISLLVLFISTINYAQNSCTTAVNISQNTYTVSNVNGNQTTLVCAGTGVANNAEWYVYTPTNNYTVTLTTDLAINNGRDTRFHVYKGNCSALVCHSGDDDSGSGFLSVATFNVLSGENYYIVFDDRWEPNGFDFQLTESAYVEPIITFETTPISTTGNYKNCVVDMNGDFLDDIVTVGSTNININFQQIDGSFQSQNFTTTPANYLPSWSIAAGDIDKNGYNDLMYGAGSGVTFMKANNTGTGYTEISGSEYVFSQRTNFIDINNDSHLDAFVCHDVGPNQFYINDGSGHLIHNQGGLGDAPSGGNYASLWTDYDNDGDLDLFLSKCNGGGASASARYNEMFRNDGDGNFEDVSSASGLYDPIQTWSSAWGDFDNDGWMDVFVGASSFVDGAHKLMKNNQDGTFTDITSTTGLDTFTETGIEHITHDFNNDGYLDIFSAGNKILFNNQDLTFTAYDVGFSVGAIGDLNNDGFLDVFTNASNWHKNTGNANNWIKINTIGDINNPNGSNINGIGARIEIQSNLGNQIREIRSGEGFRYMSSLTAHFGLGTDTEIDFIKITWPSGIEDTITNPAINSTLTVNEGQTLSVTSFSANNLVLYPNPVVNDLQVSSDILLNSKVMIYSVSGKRMYNFELKKNAINVSQLPIGTYILTLQKGKTLYQDKFIKN